MNMQPLFVILFSGLLTGNYALQGALGAAPFLGFSKSRPKAWAMGAARDLDVFLRDLGAALGRE